MLIELYIYRELIKAKDLDCLYMVIKLLPIYTYISIGRHSLLRRIHKTDH